MRRLLPFALLVFVACGSDGNKGAAGGTAGSGAAGQGGAATPDAGVGGSAECDDPPCLPLPAQGFQIRSSGTNIEPGDDREYCEVAKLPGSPSDTYYVNRFELGLTPGSHHLIVTAIDPGSATEASMHEGDVVSCSPFGAQAFGENQQPVIGIQHKYYDEKYPEGVGREYHGGQYIVFDLHMLNATASRVRARAAINFHTIDASKVQKKARVFAFVNYTINTPAGQQKDFLGECRFDHDLIVQKIVRHTHQWGTDFKVWYTGGEKDGQMIFASPDYETTDYSFDSPVLMKAGTGFRFQCSYNNTTDHALSFGFLASDEMCILGGVWYVNDPADRVGGQGCILMSTDPDGIAREH